MISDRILISDFDGVICDSTEECIVTAWNARNEQAGTPGVARTSSEVPEPYRTTLRKYRGYVKTAGEYLILLETARTGGTIPSQAAYDKLLGEFYPRLADFAELFFSARDRMRTGDEAHWLGLHTVYEGMPESLRAVCGAFDFYVVTGKDAKSVQLFFDRFGLPISSTRIYDKDVAHDKLSAIRMIVSNLGRPLTAARFLDDNIHHLLPAHRAGCRAWLASWGYHTEEQFQLAEHESVPIIRLSNWAEVLMHSGVTA